MRMKKRSKKPVRSRQSAGVKKLVRLARNVSARTMVIAAIGIGGAAVLISAARSDVRQDKPLDQVAAKPSGPPPMLPEMPAAAPAVEHSTVADPGEQDPAQKFAAVTITGCLERDADTFRLKDTAGESAPKARSWKSGFLKKGHSSVEVIDATNRVKLPAHVGQRVSVTGTLVDREMQVRSLQRVASSCSVKS